MTAFETLSLVANGLSHRVLRWGAADARPAVLLLHGYMDAGGTWSGVAPLLAARGLSVYAPDFRGFGAGARAPSGAYYHFADYVADIADLAQHASPDAPLHVVGHSMGGTVSTLYAGSFPERLLTLSTLEGLGPPEIPPDAAPGRVRRWIEDVRKIRANDAPPRPLSEDDALARLAMNHARIPKEILRAQLPHLTKKVAGGLAWAFDPLHKTPSPTPYSATVFAAFARAVTCPVLFVSGGPLGYHPPDEDERLAAYAKLTRREMPDAGHMMHWTEPKHLAEILLEHFTIAR